MRLQLLCSVAVYLVVAGRPVCVSAEDHAPFRATQTTALQDVEQRTEELKRVNQLIWEFAEVGLQEHKSSKLLVDTLRDNGFKVQSCVPILNKNDNAAAISPINQSSGDDG